ncbi:MAG TPA: outer membrane beta-barrel domain-containing protein [Myxococcales bacterium]|nr:outer membrane beta-barrel domain-containing protein [Myxococcales bacterium]
MRRCAPLATLLLAAPAAWAATNEGPGREESAPVEAPPPTLESRIPPVSGQEFGVANRFEITPGVGFSFDDAFLEKFVPQLSLGYHIGNQFYVGLKGGYALSIFAGNVDACTSAGTSCGAPSSSQQQQLPGGMSVIGFAEGGWTPFYGKVNLFAEKVFHFDFSLLLGVGGILTQIPQPVAGSVSSGSGGDSFSFALAPGVGEHFFVSDHVAITAELRDYIYFVTAGPPKEQGAQNQLMFNLGLSFLLGSGPPRG